MDAERLQKIRDRAEKATPGPWWDATEAIRSRHATRTKTGKYRARAGHRIRETAVYAILGSRQVAHVPQGPLREWTEEWQSQHDYSSVFALYWWAIRGEEFTGGFIQEDLDFIVHARQDIPDLLDEIARLERRVQELEQ